MQVFANIATALERRVAGNGSGRVYFTFRAAENRGRDENRKTTWYDVVAYIDDIEADMLSRGDFVKITGTLEFVAFSRRDGTPGASGKILTSEVERVERKPRAEQPGNGNAASSAGSHQDDGYGQYHDDPGY